MNSRRKLLLFVSLLVNLGLLGFFKYYNFFIEGFTDSFTMLGFSIQPNTLNIILPVGISFYTFQTLSYTIDIYRRKLEPTSDFVAFGSFVSFFPQLVAGPIERATALLPQFFERKKFDRAAATDGLRQILWGFFKKLVIADNCAEFANLIFNNSDTYSGSALVLGAVFFTFQIYGDFSGYSDIAIGTSKLFGFNLSRNFAYPYFSRDMAEFWRRWHISLSTWFRDYLYIPLGGSRGSTWLKVRNVFIIFLVSGFWHGANWTFLIWGGLNALYFLPILLAKRNRLNLDIVAKDRLLPRFSELFKMIMTFSLTVLAWIFFRAESLGHAVSYIKRIFTRDLLSVPQIPDKMEAIPVILLIFFLTTIEWLGRENQYGIEKLAFSKPKVVRLGFYAFIIFLIGMYGQTSETEFIYFQF